MRRNNRQGALANMEQPDRKQTIGSKRLEANDWKHTIGTEHLETNDWKRTGRQIVHDDLSSETDEYKI